MGEASVGAAAAGVCLKKLGFPPLGLTLCFLRNAFLLRYDSADRGHMLSNPNGLLGAMRVPLNSATPPAGTPAWKHNSPISLPQPKPAPNG